MRKILWLLIILLSLGGLAYYLSNKARNNNLPKNNRNFTVENISDVYKIFIADRSGKSLILSRNGDHWMLDNKYRVQQRVIESTLDAIKHFELSYIPPKNAYKDVMKELAARGLKVEVYNQRDEKLRSFYIGGTSYDGYATQMIMEGSDQPYMMSIKGFHGGLRPRFEKKYSDWRDRQVFRNLSRDLDTLRVIYPRHRNESFILSRQQSDYHLSPAFVTTVPTEKKVNQESIKKYLYDVESMVMEGYTNENPKKDSISQLLPFASVYIKKKNGEQSAWNFIPYRRRQKEQDNASQDLFYARNIERYFVFNSNQDLLLGQQQVLNNIYWGYTSFFK